MISSFSFLFSFPSLVSLQPPDPIDGDTGGNQKRLVCPCSFPTPFSLVDKVFVLGDIGAFFLVFGS